MPDTRSLGEPVALQLRHDQHTLRSVLWAYQTVVEDDPQLKAGIFQAVRRELTLLSRLEAEVLYPALDALDPVLFAGAREEHALMAQQLDLLATLSPGHGPFDFQMSVLQNIVERHAEAQEAHVFPLLDELDPRRQRGVLHLLRTRRAEWRATS